jgi:ketosteroid isomerase-like protein
MQISGSAAALALIRPGERKTITVWRFTAALIALLAASGCTDRSETADPGLAALHEFLSHAGEAVNAGDVEAEVGRFEPDGVYMWPGVPAIEGHEALRRWFEMRFSKFEIELESETLELEVVGEWAFERGRSVARIRPREGGEAQVVRGKYLNILRRQADGTWRISRRIRNADHPVEAPGDIGPD